MSFSADIGSDFREHEVLTDVLIKIPRRHQRGLFGSDIEWTCVDASGHWLAIGTSVGLVYVYNRLSDCVDYTFTAPPQHVSGKISKVKLKESVELLTALGTDSGAVSIFVANPRTRRSLSQLNAYQIDDIHHSQVTCLEWSPNGMRLLSADVDGIVACTDIDYNKEECRSYVLCKEPYPVVQLSYFRQYVLVSTRFRTVICHVSKPCHVTQVGQKDRKVRGNFGATFVSSTSVACPENAFAYVARPGLRLWKADLNGVVSETVIFQRDAETSQVHPQHLSSTQTRSEVVERSGNDSPLSSPRNGELGLLLPFPNERLISCSDTVLYLLDVEKSRQIIWSYSCSAVVDVVVVNDELFVLKQCLSKNDVPLLRFAREPLSLWISTRKLLSSSRPPPAVFSGASSASQRGHKEGLGKTSSSSSSSLSAKVFGLLANIGGQYTSPHVEEGVLPTNHNRRYDGRDDYVTEIGLEAGPEIDTVTAGFSRSNAKGNAPAISDIPIVKLDPTEVAAVQLVVSSSKPSSFVTVAECVEPVKQIDEEEIVFSSAVVKKKVKKTACKTQGFAREKSPNLSSAGVDCSTSLVTSSCNEEKKVVGSSDVREIFGTPEVVADNSTQICSKELASKDKFAEDNKPVCDLSEPSFKESSNVGSVAGLEASVDAWRSQDVEVKGDVETSLEKDETSLPKERIADVLLSDVIPPSLNMEQSDSQTETDEIIVTECNAVTAAVTSAVQNESTSVCATGSAEALRPSDSQRSTDRRSPETNPDELRVSERNFASLSVAGEPRSDFAFSAAAEDDEASSATRNFFRSRSCVTTTTTSGLKPMIGSDKIHGEVLTGRGDFSRSGGDGGVAPQQVTASYAATLTSPSDDFQSIYAGTGDYAVQDCRSGSDAVPAPRAPPRVYLPTSDAWVEISGPPRASLPLQSLAASRHTLWCVDRGCNLYHAVLGQPGLQWIAVEQQPAQMIASSPSGHIVWILHNGSAYVAVGKLSVKSPAGSEWREVARDVAYVAVDDNVAWYVKKNGDVMMQKGLGRDRPSFRSIKVPSDSSMSMLACRNGVVWSLNEHRKVMVRLGITNDMEEGLEWCSLDGFGSELVVSSLNVDAERQVAWVVDESSRIWFTNGVNAEHPKGGGLWWQVSTTGFIMPPVSAPPPAYNSVRSVTTNLSQIVASSGSSVTPNLSGGVVVTSYGKLGVCVSLACQQTLVACRSAINGHRWDVATPVGMLSTTKWRHVSVTSIYDVATHNCRDMIWLQQQSGAIFLQTVASNCTDSCDDGAAAAAGHVMSRIVEIESPSESTVALLAQTFVALCATSDSLWGLLPNGQLFTRCGINSHRPTGVEWIDVNLAQIGNQVKLVHIAVGLNNVWAVDNRGDVYLRVGVRQPVDQRVSPAWAKVPSDTSGSLQTQRRNSWSGKSGQSDTSVACLTAIGTQIVRIYAGPNDWMLWAVDNKQNLFVREGITDAVPVGLRWTSVAGLKVETLCVSNQFVYVLSSSHECYVRHGITTDCPDGEYWTVIPGKFSVISVSPYDSLWSIDLQGQLHRHSLLAIERCGSQTDVVVGRAAAGCDVSVDADWEVV